MEPSAENRSGLKKNIGKSIVLALYVLIVFIAPLYYVTPWGQNSFAQFQSTITKSMVSEEDKVFFSSYIETLRTAESGGLSNAGSEAELVGGSSNFHTTGDKTTKQYDLFYELSNNDQVNKYIILHIGAEDTGNGLQVIGSEVIPQESAVKDRSMFYIGPMGWLMLLISLLLPAFIVFTAYWYIVKELNPKWVMFLVILLLAAYISIQGEKYGVNFGVNGFMTPAAGGTWFFALPIPLGALYYWVRQLMRNQKLSQLNRF